MTDSCVNSLFPVNKSISPISEIEFNLPIIDCKNYESLSKEELIGLLHYNDNMTKQQEKHIIEKCKRIESLETENYTLSKSLDMLRDQLNLASPHPEESINDSAPSIPLISQTNPVTTEDTKSKRRIKQLLDVCIQSSSMIHMLTIKNRDLEFKVAKRDKSLRNSHRLIANQTEALLNMQAWVEEFLSTFNSDDYTDSQLFLISRFRVLFTESDDNSDIENSIEPPESIPSSALISPRVPTDILSDNNSSMKQYYSLGPFLRFVSMSLEIMHFTSDIGTIRAIQDESVKEVQKMIYKFIKRVLVILENGVIINVWIPDRLYVTCPDCTRLFTLTRRRHHCRWCGRVLCDDCSRHRVDLKSVGVNQRICNECYYLYTNIPITLRIASHIMNI